MNKIEDFIFENTDWLIAALVVFLIVCLVLVSTKQESDKKAFMDECMADHKKYECDVLWSQTDLSKQLRDAAVSIGAGAAIGSIIVRR